MLKKGLNHKILSLSAARYSSEQPSDQYSHKSTKPSSSADLQSKAQASMPVAETSQSVESRMDAWRALKETQWAVPESELKLKYPTRETFDAWMDKQCAKSLQNKVKSDAAKESANQTAAAAASVMPEEGAVRGPPRARPLAEAMQMPEEGAVRGPPRARPLSAAVSMSKGVPMSSGGFGGLPDINTTPDMGNWAVHRERSPQDQSGLASSVEDLLAAVRVESADLESALKPTLNIPDPTLKFAVSELAACKAADQLRPAVAKLVSGSARCESVKGSSSKANAQQAANNAKVAAAWAAAHPPPASPTAPAAGAASAGTGNSAAGNEPVAADAPAAVAPVAANAPAANAPALAPLSAAQPSRRPGKLAPL